MKFPYLRLIYIAMPYILAIWACNLPGRAAYNPEVSAEDLRSTLAALVNATQTLEAESSPTATPVVEVVNPSPVFPQAPILEGDQYIYLTLPGDTSPAVAARFGVSLDQIRSDQPLPAQGYIPHNTRLSIPNLLHNPPYSQVLLPDSEIVYSPVTIDFDIQSFVDQAGGYLQDYSEIYQGEVLSGAGVVERVSIESSVNPRFLLALIEQRSGWVYGHPAEKAKYPIGFHIGGYSGLYRELVMSATHLNMGYYGWRDGTRVEMKYTDGIIERMSPQLNAGTAATQSLFSKLYRHDTWFNALYGTGGFLELYERMFGDPWARAAQSEPLLPDSLIQPVLELPFSPGERWSLTAGPHPAWKTGSPRGALDLAPVTGEKECAVSRVWALAAAPGVVARSKYNVVAIDLDGDGLEQTGWVLIYMHIADHERIQEGEIVQLDTPVGHPSCEGGTSTGTHLHIARKYNGEWMPADTPIPFVLGGWQAYADARNYYGGMINGDRQVVASPVGPQTSILTR